MTLDLSTVHLDKGSHNNPDEGMCLLEAVAMFADESFTDHPVCVSPVLRSFGININDKMPDDMRQKLIPLIPRLIGTAGDGKDSARMYMAADWAVRVIVPIALDTMGKTTEANTLRNLSKIVDKETALVAKTAADAANAAYAAAYAAFAAAFAAAEAADAAYAAYAAANAAYAAAYAASAIVWNSAIELFEAMINPV